MFVPVPERLITVHEAASILDYTVQHTRLLLRLGRIQGKKIGRDWTTTEQALQVYIDQRACLPLFSKKAGGADGLR